VARRTARPLADSRGAILAIRLALLVGIVAAWEVAVQSGAANSAFVGRPLTIAQYTWTYLADGKLAVAAAVTLSETLLGFALGLAAGICIAIALWWFPYLALLFERFLVVVNAIPKVTLVPILIVLFGVGLAIKVAMAFLNVFVFAALTAYFGMKWADRDLIDLVRANSGNRWQIFRHVVWPSSFAAIVASMKIGMSLAFIGAVVGEFLASRAGLGYLAVYGAEIFNMSLVICAVLSLMVLAVALLTAVQALEHRLLGWRVRL
jgi:NitT/TauT family transport system permease protein